MIHTYRVRRRPGTFLPVVQRSARDRVVSVVADKIGFVEVVGTDRLFLSAPSLKTLAGVDQRFMPRCSMSEHLHRL